MIKHTIRFMDQTDSPYYKSKILYVYTLSTLPFRFSDEVCAPIQIPSSFRNPMFKSKVIVPCKLLQLSSPLGISIAAYIHEIFMTKVGFKTLGRFGTWNGDYEGNVNQYYQEFKFEWNNYSY